MKRPIIPILKSAVILFAISLTWPAAAHSDDNWPIPTVVLYDCNHLSAITNSSNPDSVLATASGFVYREVLSDTSFKHIFLLNYGTADTLLNDSVFSGKVGSIPDTAGIAFGDFIIESTITGSPGSYTLTVYLLDAKSRTQVASGSANFSSATTAMVEGASNNATAGILPIIRKNQELPNSTESVKSWEMYLAGSHSQPFNAYGCIKWVGSGGGECNRLRWHAFGRCAGSIFRRRRAICGSKLPRRMEKEMRR